MKSVRLIFSLVMVTVAASLFYGCMENEDPYDPYAQLAAELSTIDNHLASTSGVIKDVRGIRMVIQKLGSGLPAMESNKVKVSYTGKILGSTTPFETGTVSDQVLRGFIQGWRIAMTTLPAGSKATVYIPSPLAYGNRDQGKIPANSILVFDLDFQDVQETEIEKQKLASDTVAIDTYFGQEDLTDVVKDSTGLRYRITTQGLGPKPNLYSPVKLKLTYKLLSDDTKVVSTQELAPSASYGSRVVDQINGLKVGLQKLHEGTKATFYVPSGLAFGPEQIVDNNNAVLIPSNSNLIIEVELQEVQ
jgi:FKBP-type peptidyl-prolyl cis-trans isomerase